jgi:proliferating cell nuclear antigen
MFDMKIDNAKYWRDCLEAIVSLVDEGVFNMTNEGISLRAMDPSGISMVSFFIPDKAFSKFDVKKNTTLGINLSNLSKIMSRTRENEALVMKDNESRLNMEFISDNSRRRYKLPIIDVRSSVDKEPDVKFEVNVEIMSDPLKEIIKDASQISSYISFKASKEQLLISAFGDSGELEESHEVDGKVIKKLEAPENADVVFNLEYLDSIVKGCPIGNSIKMSFKSEKPLKLSYNIKDAVLTYYLAPYVSE